MSIRETFSNSIDFAVINEYHKSGVIKISTVVTFTMLLLEGFSEMGLFRPLSDHVSGVHNFGNTKFVSVMFFVTMFKYSSRFQN